MQYYFGHLILISYCAVLSRNDMKEGIKDFENLCIKCGKKYSEHPKTGRFNTVILFGHECTWDPDHEFRGFVKSTSKTSGYDLLDFGYRY
jgi:hypothetical protein